MKRFFGHINSGKSKKRLFNSVVLCGLFLPLAVEVAVANNDDDYRTVEFVVSAKATGGFGPILGGPEPDPTVQRMVPAIAVEEGQILTISAIGSIILAVLDPVNTTVDANGQTSPRGPQGLYTPLEEAFVDLSGGVVPGPIIYNLGALMGAFIALDGDEGIDTIIARNNDPSPFPNLPPEFLPSPLIVGDIPADSLFLIGSGPFTFTAPDDGALFLGVNDALTFNNAGAFAVSIVSHDEDNDGVLDHRDFCPGTTISEDLPTVSLGLNRWALTDYDWDFDTNASNGKGPGRSYSTTATAGCSCEQIIEAQSLGNGHTKFGCSIGVMDDWVELMTP